MFRCTALIVALGLGAAHAATRDIQINNFAFGQANATVTVNIGDTVTWSNMDLNAHTVTSGVRDGTGDHPDSRFDSGNLEPGNSYSVTFHTPGTFPYYCQYHSSMVSAITVVAPAKTWQVNIQGFAFSPKTLTIDAGDSVQWTNKDGVNHSATSGVTPTADGKWDTGIIPSNQSKTLMFQTSGDYPYFCIVHKGMTGTLKVNAGPVRGDVNGDGLVTVADVAELCMIAGGLEAAPAARVPYIDVYPAGFGDGVLDTADACQLLRFVLGVSPTL